MFHKYRDEMFQLISAICPEKYRFLWSFSGSKDISENDKLDCVGVCGGGGAGHPNFQLFFNIPISSLYV